MYSPAFAFQTGGPAVIQDWVDALDSHNIDTALFLLAAEPLLSLVPTWSNHINNYSATADIGDMLLRPHVDKNKCRLECWPRG